MPLRPEPLAVLIEGEHVLAVVVIVVGRLPRALLHNARLEVCLLLWRGAVSLISNGMEKNI